MWRMTCQIKRQILRLEEASWNYALTVSQHSKLIILVYIRDWYKNEKNELYFRMVFHKFVVETCKTSRYVRCNNVLCSNKICNNAILKYCWDISINRHFHPNSINYLYDLLNYFKIFFVLLYTIKFFMSSFSLACIISCPLQRLSYPFICTSH